MLVTRHQGQYTGSTTGHARVAQNTQLVPLSQLRGIQRMIEEGRPCLDIASQMAAVRKALDSTYVRMTVCFMQQELLGRLQLDGSAGQQLDGVLEDMQALLGKVR